MLALPRGRLSLPYAFRFSWVVLACLAMTVITACSYRRQIEKLAGPENDRFARTYLDTLARGSVDPVLHALSPAAAQGSHVRDSVARIVQEMPPGAIDSIVLIGAGWQRSGSVTRTNLTYEITTTGGWAVTNVIVAEELGIRFIDGLRVQRLPTPLETLNAFTVEGNTVEGTVAHVLWLLLAVAVVGFSIATLVIVWRTPMPRRWGWGLLALLGVGRVWLNWSTGAMSSQFLSFYIPAVTATRLGSLYGPWAIALSFPAGALLALQRRAQYLERQSRTAAQNKLLATAEASAPSAPLLPAEPSMAAAEADPSTPTPEGDSPTREPETKP